MEISRVAGSEESSGGAASVALPPIPAKPQENQSEHNLLPVTAGLGLAAGWEDRARRLARGNGCSTKLQCTEFRCFRQANPPGETPEELAVLSDRIVSGGLGTEIRVLERPNRTSAACGDNASVPSPIAPGPRWLLRCCAISSNRADRNPCTAQGQAVPWKMPRSKL